MQFSTDIMCDFYFGSSLDYLRVSVIAVSPVISGFHLDRQVGIARKTSDLFSKVQHNDWWRLSLL